MGTLHFLSRWKMALWEIGSWNCRLVVWELCISWSPPQKVGLKQNESWFYLHQPELWNKSQAEFASTMTQDCMSRRARSASTQLWSRWLAVLCAFLLPRSTHLVSFQMVWFPGFASSVKRVRFIKKTLQRTHPLFFLHNFDFSGRHNKTKTSPAVARDFFFPIPRLHGGCFRRTPRLWSGRTKWTKPGQCRQFLPQWHWELPHRKMAMVLVLEWLEWQRLVSGFLFKRLPCIACPTLQILFSYDFRLFLDANMAEVQAIPSSLVANVISWLGDRLWLGDWVGKSAGKSFLESKLLGLQMFELPWLHNHNQLAPVCCCRLSI